MKAKLDFNGVKMNLNGKEWSFVSKLFGDDTVLFDESEKDMLILCVEERF